MKRTDDRDETGGRHRPHRNRSPYALAIAFASTLLVLFLCWELRALLIALVFSVTLASAIAPLAERFELRWKVPRVVTVIVVYLAVGLLYSFLGAALFPTLKEQAISLYDRFPRYADGVNDYYNHVREMLGENADGFAVSSDEIRSFVQKMTSQALRFTSDLVTVVATAILVLFLTAFFVIEADKLWSGMLQWIPKGKREAAAATIRPLESRLGGYIRGQLLVCLAVSTFLTIGLSLLRVEHALLLGALSGLLNLVPFVGSMITAVLAILVAFNQSPALAALTFGLFALEQWFESNVIVPNLLGKQVELHPLIVLFSILIGATLLGVSGALIAVPVATAAMYLAEEFYLRPLKKREEEEQRRAGRRSFSDSDFADQDTFKEAAAILSETKPSTVKISGNESEILDTDISQAEPSITISTDDGD